MRVILILFSCIIILIVNFTHYIYAETSNRVVAIVNNDVITLYELKKRIEEVTGQTYEDFKAQEKEYLEARRQILEAMINEKVVQDKAQEFGIQATQGEIDAAVESIKKANKLTQEGLIESLKEEGVTYEKFRNSLKENIEKSRIIDLEVRSKIFVREDQIIEYYQNHQDEYVSEGQVHIASIFLSQMNPDDSEEFNNLTKKGEEILARLSKGEDFGELAKEFSQGPGADEGGYLGSFKVREIDPDLQGIIQNLPEGGISGLINRGNSIQIIKLLKRENEGIKPLEDVRDEIYKTLYDEEVKKRYLSWIKELRKNAFTKIIF